jgi:hypothetical protein
MPMTEYDGNVEIITNIETTPEERGLTTEQFKAKFDEGLKAFVEWFNSTHKTEFNAHDAIVTTVPTQFNERTGYGLVSGLGVTAQTVPDMTVAVATGTVYMEDGTRYTPNANNALAVNTADATNPRKDIVYVSSAGVISYLAGTPAATPSAPSTPSGGFLLAEITVAAGATTITNADIQNKPHLINTSIVESGSNANGRYMKFADGTLICTKNDIVLDFTSKSAGYTADYAWTLPFPAIAGSVCVTGMARGSSAVTGNILLTFVGAITDDSTVVDIRVRVVETAVNNSALGICLTAFARWK